MSDAHQIAQTVTNGQYDTMNEYERTPLAYGLDIDYVWVPEGVSVSSWGEALRLSGGRVVGTIASDHNPVYAEVQIPY
jgi:endonuclease/exonuclease/phosphatase (EEP) superfamily protein YafD